MGSVQDGKGRPQEGDMQTTGVAAFVELILYRLIVSYCVGVTSCVKFEICQENVQLS